MKKILYILGMLLFSFSALHAQDEGDEDANGKVKERFREYMQQRLNLSKDEADRTFPLFLRYFNEIRQARREFPNDQLKQRQRVIEIKLRYREQFRQTVKERPERVDPDKVEKAAVEFRKALKDEAERRNLQIRRRGGSVLNKE
ncbi:MAG: hypothetical protein SFU20_03150 [Chitinophagaceae bacterium]|nr:hypothetical protein [Chitinophagaceae bacterium]MBN8666850.1 hypothetical protein [Chitinophagales bacterium]MDX1954501.1 hypothetical protein [Chitinophagaceae bacterium]